MWPKRDLYVTGTLTEITQHDLITWKQSLLCRIAGWSILIKVATHCIPLSSQANVQYICTDFVWTKEPHRFINRNLSLYAQYRFVFVSILLFQCVIVALQLDSISFFFATGLALVTAVTGSPAFCIGIHTNVFLCTPFLVSYIIGFLLSPLHCFINFTHSVFPMQIKIFCLFKTKTKTTCFVFVVHMGTSSWCSCEHYSQKKQNNKSLCNPFFWANVYLCSPFARFVFTLGAHFEMASLFG